MLGVRIGEEVSNFSTGMILFGILLVLAYPGLGFVCVWFCALGLIFPVFEVVVWLFCGGRK